MLTLVVRAFGTVALWGLFIVAAGPVWWLMRRADPRDYGHGPK